MSKQTKQTGELKKLRKDNASLRKEQNRLQVFIKEHSRQGEATQSKITKLLTAKEAHIDELNMMIKDQKKEMKDRDEEIVSLKAKLAERTDEVSLYDDIFREITQESSALLGALATHLGQQGDEVTVNLEKDKKALVPLLKKRRDSLQDDFRFFTEHLIQLPSGTQPSALDTKIDQLQASIHDDFDDMTADCKKALSRVQQTGESVKTLQQKACGLEAMLLNPDCKCNTQLPPLPPKIPAKPSEDDLTPQLEALQKELRKEKRSVTSWRIECEHLRQDYTKIVEEKLHLDRELNKRINKVEKEKKEALKKLERLETDFKNRLEKNKQEKKELKTQFETLKESYIANKTKWKEQMAWVLNQEKSNDNRENKM